MGSVRQRDMLIPESQSWSLVQRWLGGMPALPGSERGMSDSEVVHVQHRLFELGIEGH